MNAVAEGQRSRTGSGVGLVESFQHRLARQFHVQVAAWLDTCRDLADWEDQYLVEQGSTNRRREHAMMLDELERVGEWLVGAVEPVGAEPGPILEQVRLALQDLRDSRAMWHSAVPATRQAEILRGCFP